MSKRKLYYGESGDEIYESDFDHIQDRANSENREIICLEMRLDKNGVSWCPVYQIFEPDLCGLNCDDYNPCNGKSGKCRSLSKSLIGTGKSFIIKPEEVNHE